MGAAHRRRPAPLAPAGGALSREAGLRPLVQVELATLLSGIGNAVAGVALPWIVLERTGSAAAAGLVAAAAAVPMLATSLLAGTLVDRVGRRRVSVVSDVLSAASVLGIIGLAAIGHLDVAAIAVLAVLGAALDPVGVTARETLLPAAARASGVRLPLVNSIHEAVWGMAFLIGPGIGGVLIATAGAVGALWATAVAFLGSALALAITRLPEPAIARTAGVWRSTAEGIRFVWREPLLRTLGLVTAAVIAVYLPIEGVILPTYFEELDAPGQLGLVLMAQSGAGVAGALLYGATERWLPPRATFLTALIGTCVVILGMSFLPPFGWLLALGALTGLLYGPINPILNLAMQARSPEALRGRVVGLLTSVGYAAGPLGYLLVGPLIDAVGVRPTFIGVAAVLLVLVVAVSPLPQWRLLNRLGADTITAGSAPEG